MALEADDVLAGTVSGSPPAAGSSAGDDELARTRADNLRLKNEVANLKGVTAKSGPALKAIKSFAEASAENRAVVEKILRGEPLTPRQEEKAEKAGVDLEELVEKLSPRLAQVLEERIFAADEAKEGRKSLDAWASKEYEGYDGVKGSPAFKRKLGNNIRELYDGVENNLYEVPEAFVAAEDPIFRWAIHQTMAQIKADNPQLGKKTRVEKPSDEVKAAKRAASASSSPSGSGAATDELPESDRDEILAIRRLGTGHKTGRSWSQRPATRARA